MHGLRRDNSACRIRSWRGHGHWSPNGDQACRCRCVPIRTCCGPDQQTSRTHEGDSAGQYRRWGVGDSRGSASWYRSAPRRHRRCGRGCGCRAGGAASGCHSGSAGRSAKAHCSRSVGSCATIDRSARSCRRGLFRQDRNPQREQATGGRGRTRRRLGRKRDSGSCGAQCPGKSRRSRVSFDGCRRRRCSPASSGRCFGFR